MEETSKIIKLYEQGMNIRSISRIIGCRTSAISSTLAKCGIVKRKGIYHYITPNQIKQVVSLYCDFMSINKISRKLNISEITISKILKRLNLTRKGTSSNPKVYKITPEIIKNLYFKKGLSVRLMGVELGVSRSAIQRIMLKYHLPARSDAESISMANNLRTIKFNHDQEQLLLGSMLGDACLHRDIMFSKKTGRKIETLKLIFSHSIKQIQYLEHKKSIIGGSRMMERTSGHGSKIKYYAFCHTPTLRPYSNLCLNHKFKKSISREWLDRLDLMGIAFWYQDDGCLSIQKGKYAVLTFCTNSCTLKELSLLQEFLLKFGLRTRMCRTKNPKQFMLASRSTTEAQNFLRTIDPFIVSCMKYKARCLYENRFCTRTACLIDR